jgi:hypothetical protein
MRWTVKFLGVFEIEVDSERSDAAEAAQVRLDAYREVVSHSDMSDVTLYRARADDLNDNLLRHQVEIVPSDKPSQELEDDSGSDSNVEKTTPFYVRSRPLGE